ncbi:hypothetical protein [Mycobacterium sp. E3198]|uniref:hypothetical protein n=1 Tax=Mycobacterium sp. E3198 TaxID=1834143 RepID=UPI00080171E0|nr:hypothetical protein [Mycobacterium sp. E3198]OBG37260.1 hypothetical protein A5673_16585 [Mycobacterium sp. E3198]
MQLLRVDTAAVQGMAGRWAASAGQLNEAVAPDGIGMSWQASAAAVAAAHAEVTAFTEALATRVVGHAAHAGEANSGYLANEADAAHAMATLMPPVTGV